MRDEHGRVVRWLGTSTDIESQKQAEDGLRKSEQRWHAVFDNAWVGIALTDSFLSFVAANDAFQRMVGYSLEELRTMTVLDLIHEDDRCERQVLNDQLRSGNRNRFELEERIIHKDGRLLWVRVNGSVLPTPPGETTLWVAIVEDITERKRLHEELERKRNRLRLLLDLIQQFIANLDVDSFVDTLLARLHERDHWDAAGKTLRVPLQGMEQVILNKRVSDAPSAASRTMEEIEREAILQALRESNWVVGGPHGAAKKLGLKRTTLASRMEKLGISRRR
jgi:PAS domain S-box-containing protein